LRKHGRARGGAHRSKLPRMKQIPPRRDQLRQNGIQTSGAFDGCVMLCTVCPVWSSSQSSHLSPGAGSGSDSGGGGDRVSSKGDVGRGTNSLTLPRRARDGAGSHKKQSMLQVPCTTAGMKVDVLFNESEGFDASDECTMLSSDNEQASQANGRVAGPADAPLLLVKSERTETVANASVASDDHTMRNSDHEQAPRGREAVPGYAPFLLAKNEPKQHVADASDASDDCIMLCSDHEQAPPAEAGPLLLAKHEPTDKDADASDASDDCVFHSNHNKPAPRKYFKDEPA